MEQIIDAQGKTLGRLASGVAAILCGKTSPSFERNRIPADLRVKVVHASGIRLSGKKELTKRYDRYSGYPGGLRSLSLTAVKKSHGATMILRTAIVRMLPKNKLRPLLLKRLTIEE